MDKYLVFMSTAYNRLGGVNEFVGGVNTRDELYDLVRESYDEEKRYNINILEQSNEGYKPIITGFEYDLRGVLCTGLELDGAGKPNEEILNQVANVVFGDIDSLIKTGKYIVNISSIKSHLKNFIGEFNTKEEFCKILREQYHETDRYYVSVLELKDDRYQSIDINGICDLRGGYKKHITPDCRNKADEDTINALVSTIFGKNTIIDNVIEEENYTYEVRMLNRPSESLYDGEFVGNVKTREEFCNLLREEYCRRKRFYATVIRCGRKGQTAILSTREQYDLRREKENDASPFNRTADERVIEEMANEVFGVQKEKKKDVVDREMYQIHMSPDTTKAVFNGYYMLRVGTREEFCNAIKEHYHPEQRCYVHVFKNSDTGLKPVISAKEEYNLRGIDLNINEKIVEKLANIVFSIEEDDSIPTVCTSVTPYPADYEDEYPFGFGSM